jgi:prepilin-type N-terminal cleavage/methylation domain-containing protein
MRRHARGLTLVELITVVAIITILVALLVPAVNVARRMAKDTQQRVQLAAIDVGLTAFKNDFGDYPPSNPSSGGTTFDPNALSPTYSGAQKLAEALVGRDMRGFNALAYTDLVTTDGGRNKAADAYYPDLGTLSSTQLAANLANRKALYMDPGTSHAFRLGWISDVKPGLYRSVGTLAPDTFVLCDVYGRTTVQMAEGGVIKEIRLGSPILYYRADPSQKLSRWIYNYYDTYGFIRVKELNDKNAGIQPGLWGDGVSGGAATDNFYGFIRDPRVTPTDGTSAGLGMPYRSDSYILISAGADGRYGTSDDICNFSR